MASTAGLAGCAITPASRGGVMPAALMGTGVPTLAPVKATPDRITGVYVCTRPFRAAGPRIELEKFGPKAVVHNYGHGGSGWSLSWGSGALALELAMQAGARQLGVIGCGALGLTTATLAQRAGLPVTIYAKALPPDVFSMRASGLWTPDSRICDAAHAPALADRWETMARTSWRNYQSMLGFPGNPIQWIEGYSLSDYPHGQGPQDPIDDEPEYGQFHDRVRDLTPHSVDLPAGSLPFKQHYTRRYTTLMFNIGTYTHMLVTDFLTAGGKIQVREFHHPSELMDLAEPVLVNATGYGARALFGDESIIPVRGQTARLIPQPEVTYGLNTPHVSMVPRSDGLMVQVLNDHGQFNNADTTPVRAVSEEAVASLGRLFA